MRIHNLVKSNRNLDDLYSEVTRNFDVTLTTETAGLKDAPWHEYSEDALGIRKPWIKHNTNHLREIHGDFIDIVALLVDEDDWQNGERGIYGWHLAKRINEYEIIIIKLRGDETKETIEHEIMHCLDDIVYIYTGYRLEWLLGVDDFDKYVVHAVDPRFEDYEFDDVAKQIAPHVKKAIEIKRGNISVGTISKILINVRKQALKIKAKIGKRTDKGIESQDNKQELYDVAATVYGEGRSEGDEGMRAIAHVIKNRAGSSQFPDSYSEVAYQPWQFSVWNPKNGLTEPDKNYNHVMSVLEKENPEEVPLFKKSVDIARRVLYGEDEDVTNGAVNYHTPDAQPEWADSLIKGGFKRKQIGNHIFYYV